MYDKCMNYEVIFEKAVVFVGVGEYNLVCKDDQDVSIGGLITIAVGDFNSTLFL